MRTPTEKQYDKLLILGSGAAAVVWPEKIAGPLLKHGWVTGERCETNPRAWFWVRITPEGLRALARAVEKYGLPTIEFKAKASAQSPEGRETR